MHSGPYEVRAPAHQEIDQLISCIEVCFAERMTALKREQFVAGFDPSRTLAAFDGLALVGTSVAYRVELTLPGLEIAPALALSDVTVLPTHRRQGILTSLIRQSLDGARTRGELAVVLEASEAAIYQRFGFGPATSSSRYAIERSGAALLPAADGVESGRVLLLEPGQAAEAFPIVFDVARRQSPGELGRYDWWWQELLTPAPEAGSPMRFLAAYEHEGTIDGYAVYELAANGRERCDLVLEECCATTDPAYRALFAYLLGVDLTDGLRTGVRPLDEPLRHMLADSRALRAIETRDGMWLRLVDAAGALRARRYEGGGRVVLELFDAFCPWNTGRLELEVAANGTARVERTDAAPELSCDAAALAAIYLGGTRAATLCRAGRLAEHAAGAATRLDALLHCEPLPFCMTL